MRDEFSEPQFSERVIEQTYGEKVSFWNKGKPLNKFGSNAAVGNSFETVAEFQGTVANETYVSTNIIDTVSSSNAADTQVLTLEGHTIDSAGNLSFSTQDVTLNGQTPVTLSTPLARANRAFVKASGTFNSPQTEPAGLVYFYDNTDGATAGVPNTAAATKLLISAGQAQTQKGSTSISQNDYWAVSYFTAGVGITGAGSVSRIICRLEARDVKNGGVWRPLGRNIEIVPGQVSSPQVFRPYLIVPKNHDFRIRARTNQNTAEVFAEVGGYLAQVR